MPLKDKKEQRKEYYQKNKDKIKEYDKEYRQKNKDKIKEYRQKNKDKIKEYNRVYHQKNRQSEKERHRQRWLKIKNNPIELEKRKKQHARWIENNREYYNNYMKLQMRKVSKIYYQKHIEKKRAFAKWYNLTHPEIQLKSRIKKLKHLGKMFDLSWPEYRDAFFAWSKTVKNRDGKKCIVCGDTKTLNAHHIFHKSKYPELSLNVNNGITLCKNHHREAHGWFYA